VYINYGQISALEVWGEGDRLIHGSTYTRACMVYVSFTQTSTSVATN